MEEVRDLMSKVKKLAIMRTEFEALKGSFDKETFDLQYKIKCLEDEIKEEVLTLKQSIKGEGIDVIWNKGKETWDGKILTGYAVAHPEILAARKIGNPSVSFRLHKKGNADE